MAGAMDVRSADRPGHGSVWRRGGLVGSERPLGVGVGVRSTSGERAEFGDSGYYYAGRASGRSVDAAAPIRAREQGQANTHASSGARSTSRRGAEPPVEWREAD